MASPFLSSREILKNWLVRMFLQNRFLKELSSLCRTKHILSGFKQSCGVEILLLLWQQIWSWYCSAEWDQILQWKIACGAGVGYTCVWMFLCSALRSCIYLSAPNSANWHCGIWYHIHFLGLHAYCQIIVPDTWSDAREVFVRTWTDSCIDVCIGPRQVSWHRRTLRAYTFLVLI